MALAALIAAVREADDGAGLIGTLPVAGRTLVERQARLATRAGATHIVLLVERVPGALTGAIDRLRRDGITVDVARSAGDAADRFHPDERVLVFADGALAGAAMIARLGHSVAPALLTIGEGGPAGTFERIDAGTRWTGIALVGGEMLRKTVAALGDWDLHSTLLRRAVGASARRIDIADGAELGEVEPATLVRSRAGARVATQASLDGDLAGEAWPSRFIYGPLARLAIGGVLERPLESRWLRWGAIALALLAAPALWRGWVLAGLALMVAGAMLDSLGRLLAAVRLSPGSPDDRLGLARLGAGGLALALFALHRASVDWTPLAVAIGTIVAMAALRRECRILARVGGAAPRWSADGDALVLVFALFAVATFDLTGLLALACYAAASFTAVQHRVFGLSAELTTSR
jgi:hypothetical protein